MSQEMSHQEKGAFVGPYSKKPLPNYDVEPLRRDEIVVAAAQMMTRMVNPNLSYGIDTM